MRFQAPFFHNFCWFNELENAALKACLNHLNEYPSRDKLSRAINYFFGGHSLKRTRLDFSSTGIKGSPTAPANLCPKSGVGANRSQEMISKLNLNQALTTTLVLFTVPIVVSEDFLVSEVRKHTTINFEELPLFKPSILLLFLIMDNFAQIPLIKSSPKNCGLLVCPTSPVSFNWWNIHCVGIKLQSVYNNYDN